MLAGFLIRLKWFKKLANVTMKEGPGPMTGNDMKDQVGTYDRQ